MNHINLDESWRLEKDSHILYLTSEMSLISITSERTTSSIISMTITSCEIPKKMVIRINGELVFSDFIHPNIFIKVIFRTLLLKGSNLLNFSLSTNIDSIQKENEVTMSKDIIAIKDFIITSEIKNRFL